MPAGRMTPRERVLSALAHRAPDRPPFAWGFCATPEMQATLRQDLAARGLDWERFKTAVADIAWTGAPYVGPDLPPERDIWGIEWKEVDYGAGTYREVAVPPLAGLESPEELDGYPWPDPAWWAVEAFGAEVARGGAERVRATRLQGGNPLEIYSWMTGLEEALVNLLVHPDLVHAALERITEFFIRRTVRQLEAGGDGVDLVFLADDLGGQQGPLLAPETYRAVIQPYHRRFIEAVKAAAPHVKILFHSDGAVFDLLPDLIDAGVDCLEAVQVDCPGMEPSRLAARFGGRLAFHGAVSVQQVLPRLDAEGVSAACRELVATLGEGGGYIAAPSHAIQTGTPPENVLAMVRAVLGEEDYAAALETAAFAPSA